jgi:hypothetical protein
MKGLAVGIIILFVGASVLPSINGQRFQVKIQSKETDNLLGVKELPSKMITVTVVKLCDDGSIRNIRERISVKEYDEYAKKMKASGSLEETFMILKEYNIVPITINFDKFITILNNMLVKFNENQRMQIALSTVKTTQSIVHFLFTTVNWELNPTSVIIRKPLIWCFGTTQKGGSCNASGQTIISNPGASFNIVMFLYFGIFNFKPYFNFVKATFNGFAVYFLVSGNFSSGTLMNGVK